MVDLVINQQWSIYKASKKLKLSNSTAKSILKNFEKYGTLLEKFTKNRILQLREMERSEDNLFKTTPTVKEEPSDDKVSVKAEHESANEKEAGTLENNEDYYPFLSYAVPLYFEYRLAWSSIFFSTK